MNSVLDYSTNYCNLHSLYCSFADGCPTVGGDLTYTEDFNSCKQHDDVCVASAQPSQTALRGGSKAVGDAGECKPVSTKAGFDLDSYINGKWYIQEQAVTKYLPKEQNYCVYAEYSKLDKKSFWGYTIQVHNYAQEADGTPHDSGDLLVAKQTDDNDPAKLGVSTYFLQANEGAEGEMPREDVALVMYVCCGGLACSYAAFLLSIDRSFIWTFFDTSSSSDYLQGGFLESTDDSKKHNIFTTNENKWRNDIGEEVKVWLNKRLPVWVEEQPEWWNDHAKSIIPDWAVDDKTILATIRSTPVEQIRTSRRGSVLGL